MRAPWRKDKLASKTPPGGIPLCVSRRSTLAGAASVLTAALTVVSCGVESMPDTGASLTPSTDPALLSLVRRGPGLVIAGERLHDGLLERFYQQHDFQPVWPTRQPAADALLQTVLLARAHGLDPELFHASLLRDGSDLSQLDREVLLSHAFLSYADALARGAVPIERRRKDEVLAPEPIDIPALLDQAIASPDPAAVIEALAPATPAYRALREALQTHRSATRLGDQASPQRSRAIEVNLERQRWLPRPLPSDRVWVNIADERLVMYRADQPAFSARVVVGEDVQRNQSPEFRATIDAGFYNPPWVIPADIASAEVLPKLDDDPDYLTRNRMVLLANGEVEQLPGPEAGLGLVMFDMPNRFDVYLHDTPDRHIFSRANRRISHGCIRVENPRELAALLMEQPLEAIDHQIATGNTTRSALPAPVPVFVVYQTAFLDNGGTLQFRPDFYNRDAAIWRMMQKAT